MIEEMKWKQAGAGLACAVAVLLGSASMVRAQEFLERYDFHIQEYTLGQALKEFVQLTNAQLILPHDLAGETGINPVVGQYTIEEALIELMEGTEFSGGLTSGGVIVISLHKKESPEDREANMKENLKRSLLSGIAAVFFGSSGAHAQTEVIDGELAETKSDEIIVSARRREESLLNVPESITVFDAQAIEDLEIRQISDFARLTPGVNVQQGFTAGDRPLLAFRGIGAFGGTAPALIILSDGVYSPFGEPLRAQLFDVERIEVVKGPQGSIYGRDTIGGVINVVTKRPGNEYEVRMQGAYEPTSNEKSFAAAVNIPLVEDKLAARVSGQYLDSDGYFDNALGLDHDTRKEYGGRLRLFGTPTDTLTLDFRLGYNKYDNGGYNASFFAADDDTTIEDVGVLNAVNLAEGFRRRDVFDVALRADLDLGFAELTSLTQFVDAENELFQDADLGLAPGLELTRLSVNVDRNFSHEFRLVSPGDKRFRWIIGAFYENGDFDFSAVDTEISIPLGQLSDSANEVDTERYSVFGQVDFDLTDRLTFSAALRYDDDTRDQTILRPAQSTQSIGFDRVTPKISLTYSATDEISLYATYAEGFRSGGFDATTALPFETEQLKSYEVGVKANLFDNRVFATVAGYRISLTDQQLSALTTNPQSGALTTTTVNLGESRTYGMELAVQARVADGFDVNLGFDLLNPEILASPTPTAVGNRTQLSTEYTINVGAQYHYEISDEIGILSRIDYYRQGTQYWNDANTLSQDPYGVLAARIALETDRWTLAVSGDNILDKVYNDQIFEFAPGLNAVYPGLPARWRVTGTVRF